MLFNLVTQKLYHQDIKKCKKAIIRSSSDIYLKWNKRQRGYPIMKVSSLERSEVAVYRVIIYFEQLLLLPIKTSINFHLRQFPEAYNLQ